MAPYRYINMVTWFYKSTININKLPIVVNHKPTSILNAIPELGTSVSQISFKESSQTISDKSLFDSPGFTLCFYGVQTSFLAHLFKWSRSGWLKTPQGASRSPCAKVFGTPPRWRLWQRHWTGRTRFGPKDVAFFLRKLTVWKVEGIETKKLGEMFEFKAEGTPIFFVSPLLLIRLGCFQYVSLHSFNSWPVWSRAGNG